MLRNEEIIQNRSEQTCVDREKMIQECKNPIAVGNYKWIFANHELFATHG